MCSLRPYSYHIFTIQNPWVHPPIYIDGTAVEKVESFKFLGVHITDKLKWTTHTYSVVKKAQQSLCAVLYNLIINNQIFDVCYSNLQYL
jgi:hypothetical protein